MQPGSVLSREGHLGQDGGLGLLHQSAPLRPARARLIGDVLPNLDNAFRVRLVECLPDRGRDNSTLPLWHMSERIAHPRKAAPLPDGIEHPAERGLQTGARVRDHQLQPVEAKALETARKLGPEGFCLRGRTQRPLISRRLWVFTATANMAATETIRPPSRIFR
jgi:hypothetical protein